MAVTDHMPDDAPTTPRNRVRVFVDFWNYTLSMRHVDSEFHPSGRVSRDARYQGPACRLSAPGRTSQPGLLGHHRLAAPPTRVRTLTRRRLPRKSSRCSFGPCLTPHGGPTYRAWSYTNVSNMQILATLRLSDRRDAMPVVGATLVVARSERRRARTSLAPVRVVDRHRGKIPRNRVGATARVAPTPDLRPAAEVSCG